MENHSVMTSTRDIAHLTLIGTLLEATVGMGGAATKGSLMRQAIKIAEQIPEVNYENFGACEAAFDAQAHPISKFEGVPIRDGSIFILPQCMFAQVISTYFEFFGELPDEYTKIVKEYNKPNKLTKELMVGCGTGVSPFCAMHQPLRSAAGKKIKIGGNHVQVIQLGCKTSDGKKFISHELCQIAGVNPETVEKHLDNGMCAYMVNYEPKSRSV